MVIILDISDLTRAQKELEEKASNLKRSNEELERFAYVASHDLQGPLRTITSYLQLLEQRYFADLGDDAEDFISFSVRRSQTHAAAHHRPAQLLAPQLCATTISECKSQ
jgi:light-regulated signal transduction histidine kinase (bacteriophytochrome)